MVVFLQFAVASSSKLRLRSLNSEHCMFDYIEDMHSQEELSL